MKLAILAALAAVSTPALASTTPVFTGTSSQSCLKITRDTAWARSYSRIAVETHSGTALPAKDYAYKKVTVTYGMTSPYVTVCTTIYPNASGTFTWRMTPVRFAVIPVPDVTATIAPAQSPPPAPTPAPAPLPTADAPLPAPTGSLEVRSAIEAPWTDDKSVQPAWGSGAIPGDAGIDRVGAYRQVCGAGGLNYDDSLVYPGQPGKSHLHQYYGQMVDAWATYASMRAGKKSTCANGLYPGNLSAYWMPALLDGQGNVVQPHVVPIYYKRFPSSYPECGDPRDVANRRVGICTGIPTRFNMIAGSNMAGGWTLNQRHDFGRQMGYKCNGITDAKETLREALDACPVGGTLIIDVNFPECFDGRVDSPDHRSHVAYASYGDWGYLRCPFTHPFLMPQLHVAPQYPVTAALKATGRLSCGDDCLHFDYREAWTERLRKAMETNDMDGHKNASGGDLGDGQQLIGAQQPEYGWTNPNPVVPVPPMPTM